MNNIESFGQLIKQLRISKKLKLREVAQIIGIDTSMLGKIEKDNRKASQETINKLAEFFKINPSKLKIALKSDIVAYKVLKNEADAIEILKVAEQKIKYNKIQQSKK